MVDLTLKERKFIKYYLETGNISQSAIKAGYKHREQGFETLSNLINKGLFDCYLEQLGIDDKIIAQTILAGLKAMKIQSCNIMLKKGENGKYVINENSNDFIEIEDYATRHRYLETVLKLKKKFIVTKEEETDQKQSWQEYFKELMKSRKKEIEKGDVIHIIRVDYPELERFQTK